MTIINKYIENYSMKKQCYEALKAIQDKKIEKNNERIKTAEKSTERAKKKINKIPYPYWTKEILEYMAKDMLQYFPDGSTYEILGPFGIGCRTSIWIKCKDYNLLERGKKYITPYLYSFVVEPNLIDSNPQLYFVNEKVNTKEFYIGTIGKINNLNNPVNLLSNDTTIKEFILMYYPDFEITKNK